MPDARDAGFPDFPDGCEPDNDRCNGGALFAGDIVLSTIRSPLQAKAMRLDALFRPRSIAVIGASDKPTVGRRVIASLERIGFSGAIYPVNPNYATVMNRKCYATMAEVPEAPDVAVLCVGHARVLDALRDAAERGVKAAVIYDGGFAEQGSKGGALQRAIEGLCREAGIALCGPNCMGVLNPHHRSTTYLQELRDPSGLAGNVGIVSQSGAFCISLLTDTRRFGFSHVVSSGNEAVLIAAAPSSRRSGTRIVSLPRSTAPRRSASQSSSSRSGAASAPGVR